MVDEATVRAWVRWGATGCPSPIVVNPKDGSILLYVPAGEFEMGSEQGWSDERPVHRVFLDAYYIGAFAVTNAQYARFVKSTRHRPPNRADGGVPIWKKRTYPPEMSDHPVVCVSWDDATAYAQWSELELPTEAQWERAARGFRGFDYPWGATWDGARCRHNMNRGAEQTTVRYALPAGVSGEGAYNLSGNVSEWCTDWYADQYFGSAPTTGTDRIYRGGSWLYEGVPGYFRAAYRSRNTPGYRAPFLGFRLAKPLASLPSGAFAAASG